ncbi:hypothetical protein CcaCcLH18_09160 [Colletotrichum camelliae]|nr:hypothetical protein CcaCcLH18_09160 [Colletotrichum camelliae]
MAKLTNLPDDVLFIIADLLRHRGMTIDEAFAQAHKDDSVDSDRAIGRCLMRGFDDVRSLSITRHRFQSVMRRAWPSIGFTGHNATRKMVSFLEFLDKHPEARGWVRTIYLNLELSQQTNHRFDQASVDFLRRQAQQASKKGVKWSEGAWLSNDQGWHGHRIEMIALLLLANLPNLQELGLALSGSGQMTYVQFDLGENLDSELLTLCPQLSYLALRPANSTVPAVKGLYSIIGKIGAEPTHLYIDNLYPVRMGLESASLCSTLFEKVTHLTIAGTVLGGEYRDAFDSVMADCGPLLDFRLVGHSRDSDAYSDFAIDPLHILEGLREGDRHTKTLRSLVIDLSKSWVFWGKSGVDYLDEFENLENLWIDGDSLYRGKREMATVNEQGEQLFFPYYEDALWSLPQSLKRICFTHQLELFEDFLRNFAGHLDYLTNLERVYLRDVHYGDSIMEDLKEEFETSGVPVTITEVDAVMWEAS